MTVTNTSLLGLALPTTGTESGVWGDDVNNGFTILVDISVAGTNNITQDSDITLAVSNGSNSSSFTSTATNSTVAQYYVLNCTGARTANRNIIAPASSKTYYVINSTTTATTPFTITIKKSGGTGVTIPPGAAALVAYNGTDFQAINAITGVLGFSDTNIVMSAQASANTYVQGIIQNSNSGTSASADFIVANNLSTATTYYGDFGINSSTFSGTGSLSAANATYVTATSGDLALGTTTSNAIHFVVNSGATDAMTINTSGALALNGSYGTSGQVLTSGGSSAVPTWTTVIGTVPSPFTANGVVYASSTSALATGSALTFDGNNVGVGLTPSAWDGTFKNIQIGGNGYSGSFYSQANGDNSNGIVLNAYYSSGWKYTASSKASTQYEQNNGIHKWSVASSGTANNAISFIQAMTLNNSGYLGIGTTSPTAPLQVNVNNSTTTISGSQGGVILQNTNSTSGAVNAQFFANSGGYYSAAIYTTQTQTGNAGDNLILNTKTSGGSWNSGLILDTSGNLGLGVTPSAWSGAKAFQVYNASMYSTGGNTFLANNYYYNGSNNIYTQSNYATALGLNSGQFQFFVAPSGTAGGTISFTQAMTLTNTGDLLFGTTSDYTSGSGYPQFITSSALIAPLSGVDQTAFVTGAYQPTYNGSWKHRGNYNATMYQQASGVHAWFTNNSTDGGTGNNVTFTQAMTLTNNGLLGIGCVAPYAALQVVQSGVPITSGAGYGGSIVQNNGGSGYDAAQYIVAGSGGNGRFIGGYSTGATNLTIVAEFYSDNTNTRACVRSNQSNGVYLVSGGTSWNSLSDERSKENLVPITDAVNKVLSLRAVTGNYIADQTKKSRSFLIAQDVEKVLPEAVDTSDPKEYGLAYTDVIPLLVASIKELSAKVTALEAKLGV